MTGLVLGTASGLVGVSVLYAGPLRLWQQLVLLALAVAVSGLAISGARATVAPVEIALGVFVVTRVVVELIDSAHLHRPPSLPTAVLPLFFLLAHFTARCVVTNERALRSFLVGLVAPGVPVGLLALLQTAGIDGVTRLLLSVTDSVGAAARLETGNLTRSTSLVGHWTGLGNYLCVLLACLMILVAGARRRPVPSIYTASIVLFLAALLTTLTFSAVLLGVAVILLSARIAGVFGRLLTLFLVSAAGAILFFGDMLNARFQQQYGQSSDSLSQSRGILPETISFRLDVWHRETFPAILERPWLGWSHHIYQDFAQGLWAPPSLRWPYAESQYLDLAMTGGVVSLAAFALVLVQLDRQTRALSPTYRRPVRVLLGGAVLAALMVPQFTDAGFPLPFFALMGAISGLHAKDAPSARVPSSRPALRQQEPTP